MSDLYSAVDGQQVTLLGLLDLSAAFDCADYDILVRQLQLLYGIRGSALAWFRIVSNRTHSASVLQWSTVSYVVSCFPSSIWLKHRRILHGLAMLHSRPGLRRLRNYYHVTISRTIVTSLVSRTNYSCVSFVNSVLSPDWLTTRSA